VDQQFLLLQSDRDVVHQRQQQNQDPSPTTSTDLVLYRSEGKRQEERKQNRKKMVVNPPPSSKHHPSPPLFAVIVESNTFLDDRWTTRFDSKLRWKDGREVEYGERRDVRKGMKERNRELFCFP